MEAQVKEGCTRLPPKTSFGVIQALEFKAVRVLVFRCGGVGFSKDRH